MKYFTKEELSCGCGCGLYNITPEVEDILDRIRGTLDRPVYINSGSRCAPHNAKEGGKLSSSHLEGLAVDIKCSNSSERSKLLKVLMRMDIDRVGIAKTFIHFDIDENKALEVTWLY